MVSFGIESERVYSFTRFCLTWRNSNIFKHPCTSIQVSVITFFQNYSRIPTTPNSGSDCSTESNVATTSSTGTPAHCTTISSSSSNSSAVCRICQDVEQTENLRTLCQCTGSIAKYHVSCLEKWLSVSNTNTCELCQQHFATRRKPRPFSEVCITYFPSAVQSW